VTFEEAIDQALDMLRRRGCVTYRTLKRQFALEDEAFEDLKAELLYSHSDSVHDDGRGLVWTGEPPAPMPKVHHETDSESRFQTLLSLVRLFLQREQRVPYRTLQYVFALDDAMLEEIREDLRFRRLAIDEDGKGLVWIGEVQAPVLPTVTVSSQQPSMTPVVNLSAAVPTWPPGVAEADPEPNGPTAPSEVRATHVSPDAPISAPEPSRSA
jgi:hypothetical protein